MTTEIKEKIENLESIFNWQNYLKNEVIVEDGDKKVVYVGEAIGLYVNGANVMGSAALTRYDRNTEIKTKCSKKRILVRWFPPKFRIEKSVEDVPVITNRRIWQIQSDDYKLFASFGKTATAEDHPRSEYRADLNSKAINRNIQLSRRLFDLVFNPIDEKIMEMYKQAMLIK